MTYNGGQHLGIKRRKVRNLIAKRLHAIGHQEPSAQALMPNEIVAWQDKILDDVLDRANGYLDQKSLIVLIDICIQEGQFYERAYRGRSLGTYYSLRVRVLKKIQVFIHRFLNPKRWLRPRRKTRK